MTIQQVDINKLQSYSGKTTKSFEQLIYTLMKKEYGGLGKFTPIAGDGGDLGVEFYLTFLMVNDGDGNVNGMGIMAG